MQARCQIGLYAFVIAFALGAIIKIFLVGLNPMILLVLIPCGIAVWVIRPKPQEST